MSQIRFLGVNKVFLQLKKITVMLLIGLILKKYKNITVSPVKFGELCSTIVYNVTILDASIIIFKASIPAHFI